MKKIFKTPVLSVLAMAQEDILTVSGVSNEQSSQPQLAPGRAAGAANGPKFE